MGAPRSRKRPVKKAGKKTAKKAVKKKSPARRLSERERRLFDDD